MEIKCNGNSKTSSSTKKTGQDGCQVCAKNNSHSDFFLLRLRLSFSSFSPPLATFFLVVFIRSNEILSLNVDEICLVHALSTLED